MHRHAYEPSPVDPHFQVCRNARFGCDRPQMPVPTRPAPAQEHSETSKEAARSVDGKQRHRDRILVYELFQRAGNHGITDEDLIAQSGLPENTARPRRIDLVNEQLVVDSGRVRKVRSGRDATIWTLRL